jgi:hypothetical protein
MTDLDAAVNAENLDEPGKNVCQREEEQSARTL